jgi:Amino acid synthesis
LLTEAALKRFDAAPPSAYGKAAIVGVNGDLEHAAAMIHVRLGLAMRRGIKKGGRALIPGNAKIGGPGAQVDLVFGGIDDGWDYDAMDTSRSRSPTRPNPDEIVLILGFATGRPNARIRGTSTDDVAALVERFRF